jgi:uncharacterized protein YodC (DUF2158 family)
MATHKFKVGDIVQLKSGGPEMTISNIRSSLSEEYDEFLNPTIRYTTHWFSGKKLETGSFPEEVLQAPKTSK